MTARRLDVLPPVPVFCTVAAQTVFTYSPGASDYSDQALAPVSDDGDETLDLLTKTTGGRAAVAHVKKIAALTGVRVT
jgi:hypothetical protein